MSFPPRTHKRISIPTTTIAAAVAIFALGCASSAADSVDEPETAFQPWTAERIGSHPGDLGPTARGEDRTASAFAVDPDEMPVSYSPSADDESSNTSTGPVTATATGAWHLYTHTLSRTAGDTCRFSPSCSRFAVEATGLGPEGLPLAFGRLQRNHLDDEFYEATADGYLLDPLSHYLFWRTDAGLDAHGTELVDAHAWYVFVRAAESSSPPSADE